MGDNGNGQSEIKTPEELAIKKSERFKTNPDEFLHISDIVIGTRILSNGMVQCIVGRPDQLLLEISLTRIQYEVHKVLAFLERERQKAKEAQDAKKILPNSGGIMNFVRRKRI